MKLTNQCEIIKGEKSSFIKTFQKSEMVYWLSFLLQCDVLIKNMGWKNIKTHGGFCNFLLPASSCRTLANKKTKKKKAYLCLGGDFRWQRSGEEEEASLCRETESTLTPPCRGNSFDSVSSLKRTKSVCDEGRARRRHFH